MQKTQNLQEGFLNRARTERVGVTVFLVNGFQMRGTIRGFDSFVVLLESEGRQQVIYKHAISTIVYSVTAVLAPGSGRSLTKTWFFLASLNR